MDGVEERRLLSRCELDELNAVDKRRVFHIVQDRLDRVGNETLRVGLEESPDAGKGEIDPDGSIVVGLEWGSSCSSSSGWREEGMSCCGCSFLFDSCNPIATIIIITSR